MAQPVEQKIPSTPQTDTQALANIGVMGDQIDDLLGKIHSTFEKFPSLKECGTFIRVFTAGIGFENAVFYIRDVKNAAKVESDYWDTLKTIPRKERSAFMLKEVLKGTSNMTHKYNWK